MLKRLALSLVLTLWSAVAFAAGTVPGFSLATKFDLSGNLARGCKLYVIQAGTTSTPQNAYQDSALTILQPNPMTCDAAGQTPQFFVADGTIKLRLTTSTGTNIYTGDSLLVIGASSGGGGGGTVDATTILATGDFKLVYNTGSLTGFVRCNGRTIGNVSSGATERANADTSALYVFLYNADTNLSVATGRGASAAADYAANKALTLPDCKSRTLAGLSDMGGTDSGRLTTTYFGCTGLVLGCAAGAESKVLTTPNLPPYTPTGQISLVFQTYAVGGGGTTNYFVNSASGSGAAGLGTNFVGTAQGGLSTPVAIMQPTILVTIYIKL